MADFGLYSALRYKDDWQSKRADQQVNTQALERHRAALDNDLKQRQETEARMTEMFDTLANMDVLAEDQDRVKTIEADARKKIYAGVAKYNGDLKRYVNVGGISDLSDYRNSVLQSKEVKNAINNKMNLGLFLDASSKGMYVKPLMMESEVVDPITGEKKVVPKQVSFEDQYKMFKEGKIDQLQFSGAEKPVDVSMMDFKATMKDHTNPYSKDNIVTASQIYEVAIGKGASKEQATQLSKNYTNVIDQGGEVWRWGAKDMGDYNLNVYNAQTGRMNATTSRMTVEQKMRADMAASQENQMGNQWATSLLQMSDGEVRPIEPDMKTNKLIDVMIGLNPATEDSDGSVPAGQKYKADPNKTYFFQNGEKVDPSAVNALYVLDYTRYVKINGQPCVELTTIGDDDTHHEGISTSTLGVDYISTEGQNRGFTYTNTNIGGGVYTGKIYVPITEFLNDASSVQGINKKRNLINSKHEYTAASIGNIQQQQMVGDYYNNGTMNANNTTQGLIETGKGQ
jgi:hypothetical protein